MSPATAAETLKAWVAHRRRLFVLTGAGVSTASGIPDYRDATGAWKRPPPVTFQAFTGSPLVRARYWARSMIGWPRMAQAVPNEAHAALAAFEATGRLSMLLTQNVDGLHRRAGSQCVIDLHGALDDVVCLACHLRLPRSVVQQRLVGENPDWAGLEALQAPDGDADLERVDFDTFRVPACPRCTGMLKPDVVFFGESVPALRVLEAREALAASDGMLVAGSSLMVYSGYRFARFAHEAGIELAILTRGITRADDLATLRFDADCTQALPVALDARPPSPVRDS